MLFEEGKANQSKKLKLDCDQNMEGQASALDTKALNKFSRQNAALGIYLSQILQKIKYKIKL